MSAFAAGEQTSASKLSQKTLLVSSSAPSSPKDGQLWYDTNSKILKEWHADISSWKNLGASPAQSLLASDFSVSTTTPTDTGLTVTTKGASFFIATMQLVMTGTGNGGYHRLVTNAGSIYYFWRDFKDGSDPGTSNYKASTVNGDIYHSNPVATNTREIILVGFVSTAATVKIQSFIATLSNTLTTKANSQLVAYPA